MFALRAFAVVAVGARGVAGQATTVGADNTQSSALRGASARAQSFGEIAKRELSSVLGYEQHTHLNCYTGHGAAPLGQNDGLQADVHSVDGCGRACDENGCSCFVYFHKYDECFLRLDCDLPACEPGVEGEESYEFDTFTPGPQGGECFCNHGRGKWIPYSPPGTLACECYECDHGYMTTDMECVPVNYIQNEHLNCYSGHGGTSVWPNDGLQANVRDVQGCQDACNSESACTCFVFFSEQNKCFLRSDCKLTECETGVPGEESYSFDTYISSAGR